MLSAKNEERLKEIVNNLYKFISQQILNHNSEAEHRETDESLDAQRSHSEPSLRDGRRQLSILNLNDLAYTLQVGREAMENRVVFVVGNTEELIKKLEGFIAGKFPIVNCYQGQVKPDKESTNLLANDDDSKEMIQKWISNRKIKKLAQLWAQRYRNRLEPNLWRSKTATYTSADVSLSKETLLV